MKKIRINGTLENDALKKELEKYKSHPHWMETTSGVSHCSECDWIKIELRGYKFCPNCGTRMVCE